MEVKWNTLILAVKDTLLPVASKNNRETLKTNNTRSWKNFFLAFVNNRLLVQSSLLDCLIIVDIYLHLDLFLEDPLQFYKFKNSMYVWQWQWQWHTN